MNWAAISFDWNQVRAFLATVEEGSLTAASKALGLTQPTLGRQVSALESALGVVLFERVGRSLVLTPSGLELLDHVKAMADAASRISLAASGQSQTVEGQVSVTCSDVIAAYLLPDILAGLRRDLPGVVIDVVATNEIADLQRREADIAIRHLRPEQPDLIARQVRVSTGHFYAATRYLDQVGRPKTRAELARLDFVGLQPVDRYLEHLCGFGIPITRKSVRMLSENGVAAWEMMKTGLGVAVMLKELGEATPGVEQVTPDLPPIPVPFWLIAHRELYTSRRIRLVYDHLAAALA